MKRSNPSHEPGVSPMPDPFRRSRLSRSASIQAEAATGSASIPSGRWSSPRKRADPFELDPHHADPRQQGPRLIGDGYFCPRARRRLSAAPHRPSLSTCRDPRIASSIDGWRAPSAALRSCSRVTADARPASGPPQRMKAWPRRRRAPRPASRAAGGVAPRRPSVADTHEEHVDAPLLHEPDVAGSPSRDRGRSGSISGS